MASHIEMKRLAENPTQVRAIAAVLLQASDADWTEWELDFLEHMAVYSGPDPLSMRQREVLVELRDKARLCSRIGSFSVASLVHRCWQARADLDEEDEAFVARVRGSGATALRYKAAFRLLKCAKALDIVEGYVGVGH